MAEQSLKIYLIQPAITLDEVDFQSLEGNDEQFFEAKLVNQDILFKNKLAIKNALKSNLQLDEESELVLDKPKINRILRYSSIQDTKRLL